MKIKLLSFVTIAAFPGVADFGAPELEGALVK